jgi:hypothetical protein
MTPGVSLPRAFWRLLPKFFPKRAFSRVIPPEMNRKRTKTRILHKKREGCGTQP